MSLKPAIQNAIAVWNSALAHPVLPGVPRLAWTGGGSPDVLVVKADSGLLSSEIWCGGTNAPPTEITMVTNCANHSATFQTTLIHEMSHVLGFTSVTLETESSPTNCVIHLGTENHVNSSVCQHELDFIYGAYGYLSINTTTFWGKPIVTGFVGLPDSVTLVKGDSLAVTATQLRFARQLTGNQPLGSTSISWSSDNVQVADRLASIGATTWITGEGVGTTTIRAGIGSGLSSLYQRGGVMTHAGQEIAVTVTPAPTGPFKASSISGPATPVTGAGTYPLTATVVNPPPGGTLEVRWQVTYSNDSLGPFDTGYGPNAYSMQVPAGSYNIRVTATPRSNLGNGYFQGIGTIRDFPVCTGVGGGGGDLAASEAGGGSDAVEGC